MPWLKLGGWNGGGRTGKGAAGGMVVALLRRSFLAVLCKRRVVRNEDLMVY
jgi:hypothetical protein